MRLFGGLLGVDRGDVAGEVGDVVAVVANSLEVAQDVDEVDALLGIAFPPVQSVDVVPAVPFFLAADAVLEVVDDVVHSLDRKSVV